MSLLVKATRIAADRRIAPVLVGLALALASLKLAGCSLNPTPPNPHATETDPTVDLPEPSGAPQASTTAPADAGEDSQ